jgi:hypothetical protein
MYSKVSNLTIAGKYYTIIMHKNLNIHIKRLVKALIVKVSESICLNIEINKVKKFVSKYLKKKSILL